MADDEDDAQVYADFHEAVNMAPAQIEKWLERDESKQVGFKDDDGGESVGHASGRRIVKILRTRKTDLDGDDYAHMRKVIGYVRRHCAQGPQDEDKVPDSRWRHSLMNWGHDPLKDRTSK